MNPHALRKVLIAAHRDQVLASNKTKKIYLHSSVNNANKILYLIKVSGDNGLCTSQVAHRTKLNANTVRAYLAALEGLELLERTTQNRGLAEDIFFVKSKY